MVRHLIPLGMGCLLFIFKNKNNERIVLISAVLAFFKEIIQLFYLCSCLIEQWFDLKMIRKSVLA